jgi:aspartyl-tRNA(Asn)/glutamyl-tRNA(Gln) amidotransferase subunit C
MKVKIEEVKYIAKLAKLKFTEQEAEKMAGEFEAILGHFKSIDSMDLSEVEFQSSLMKKECVLRKDESTDFEDKNKLFSNVKSMRDGYIEVPRIIEG